LQVIYSRLAFNQIHPAAGKVIQLDILVMKLTEAEKPELTRNLNSHRCFALFVWLGGLYCPIHQAFSAEHGKSLFSNLTEKSAVPRG
jgi:hypothetical protein